MAIQIPLHLVNQTGPEWDKFVKDAERAGFAANKAGSVADNVLKNLIGRQSKETALKIDKLADSFGKADSGAGKLVETVKTLNALNITPYGYERTAYRLSGLLSSVGPGGLAAIGALGAGALAATTALHTFNVMLARNDEQAIATNRAWKSVGETFRFFTVEMGQGGPFQTAMKTAEILMDDFNVGILGIDAAIDKFKEKGFAGLNMKDIAEGAAKTFQKLLKFRVEELKFPINVEQDTQKKVEDIRHARTIVELKEKQLALEKELVNEAKKGAFSDLQKSVYRAQLVAMAEKERELIRKQADDLKAVADKLEQSIKRKADQISGKTEGPLSGVLDEVMSDVTQDSVFLGVANRRGGGNMAKRNRAFRALQQGNIGTDKKGKRRVSNRDMIEGEYDAYRERLQALAEQRGFSQETLQAMSDVLEQKRQAALEQAAQIDEMNGANRGRGAPIGKGRRASPVNKGQQAAQRNQRNGLAAPDQGLDLTPKMVSDLAEQEAKRAKAQGQLNDSQLKVLENSLRSISGEFSQIWERMRQQAKILDSYQKGAADRQRAAQAGLSN